MALDALVSHSPWAVAVLVGVPVVGKLIALGIALRGADPKERPSIIKAVAELFRWRNHSG